MSRLVHSIATIATGAALVFGLTLVHQSAFGQLGGVGDVVGGAADAVGGAAGAVGGAAGEAAGAARGAVGEAAGAARGAAEAATEAVGETGAQLATDAEVGAALGASFNAADNRLSVSSVQQGSILANAGLQPGDEILAVAGQQVTSEAELIGRIRAAADAGNQAILRVRRNGQLQELTVNLGARLHTAAKVVADPANLGVNASADSVLQSYVGTQLGGPNGLVIQNVRQGSLAARANLTNGDEVLSVGGREVTPENFYPQLQADLLEDGRADIHIRRGNQVYRAPINLCR